jgi:hypothetical protein
MADESSLLEWASHNDTTAWLLQGFIGVDIEAGGSDIDGLDLNISDISVVGNVVGACVTVRAVD